MVSQPSKGLLGLVINRKVWERPERNVSTSRAAVHSDVDSRVLAHTLVKLGGSEQEFVRGEYWSFNVVSKAFISSSRIAVDRFEGICEWLIDDHSVARKIVEQGGHFLEEKWQIVFNPGGGASLADGLIDRASLRLPAKSLVPGIFELAKAIFAEREFFRGQTLHALNAVNGTLGVRIKGPDGFNFVVKPFDPIGCVVPHREEIQNRSSNGELSSFSHGLNCAIGRAL